MGRKRKKPEEGGADWMSTYGDMVTLLLCFFVMLYSMSSVDQQKWAMIVKSFNPSAGKTEQVVLDAKPEEGSEEIAGGSPDVPAPDQFDQLYLTIAKAIETQGLSSSVEVSKGDGFTFITFRDQVFFDGDSYVLKPLGKQLLDSFVNALIPASPSIKEIHVLGHTSQAAPGYPNDVYTDRMLAAQRSTEVVAYIQAKNVIDPVKLVQGSFGQNRPIDTYETEEGRAHNRRVEMIITKNGSVEKSLSEYYEQMNQAGN